jgi:hypothetical protein
MTASFSLRLRLKVYSFKCICQQKAFKHATLQRPTVSEQIPSQRDRHLRWLSLIKRQSVQVRQHTNGLG